MLTQTERSSATAEDPPRAPTATRWERLAVFTGVVVLVLVFALRGGGSYDVVSFEGTGFVVWGLLAVGVAAGALPRRRPSRWLLALLAALTAYAAWVALSLTWTDSRELTFIELARDVDYIGIVLLLGTSVSRRTWRAAAAGLGASAFIVCLIALGSRLSPGLFGYDPVAIALQFDRLSRPFGYWNAVGAWGAMSIALGLTWSAHDSLKARRALAAALVIVAGSATYLSYSRAAIAGTALAVLVALLASRHRIVLAIHALVCAGASGAVILAVRHTPAIAHATGTAGNGRVWLALLGACIVAGGVAVLTRSIGIDRRRVPRRITHPAVAALVALGLAAAAVLGPHAASRAWHSFKDTAVPTQNAANPTARLTSLSGTRYPLWKAALDVFSEHPGLGTGAGTTQFWWNERATDGEFIHDAHNIWLQNLAELGLPGGVLIVAVAITALGAALAARRRARRGVSVGASAALLAVLAVYLVHASVDWMWQSMAVTVLALAAAAVAAGRLGAGRARLFWPLRIALAILAAGAATLQLPGLISSRDVRASQVAARAGHPSRALALASAAISAEPWSASAYEQRGLVLEIGRRYPAAAADLRRAIDREPQNYTHWVILARIEAEEGLLGPAQQALARAHQLRPRALVFRIGASSSG